MNFLLTIAISAATALAALFGSGPLFGSTITTTNSSDTLTTFRTNTNTNLANLNTDKLESGSTAAALTITNASTTNLSVANGATFGSIGQSKFSSSGVLTLVTALTVANGGTGASALTADQITYTNHAATGLISVASSSLSVSAGLTTSGTAGALVGGTALTLKQVENRSFTMASTSAFVGTTTIPLETGYGELWNTIKCYTNVGTVNVQVGYGTASTSMFNASTTIGTITFASNNTMTAGNQVKVDIGTPATSPTSITCTANDTY